jgi:hypothetical protein
MGQHGLRSAGEDSGHPTTARIEKPMPYGEHPGVNPMQPPCFHALLDGVLAQSGDEELVERHHTVLRFCQIRDLKIDPPSRSMGRKPLHI